LEALLLLKTLSKGECGLSLLNVKLFHFLMRRIIACLHSNMNGPLTSSYSANVMLIKVILAEAVAVILKWFCAPKDATAGMANCNAICDHNLTFGWKEMRDVQ
jgi:hypothetical protein